MADARSPYSELAGKRAFITGAAHWIGRTIAAALSARAGAPIAIADIDGEPATRVAAEIGAGAIALPIDVRDRASVDRGFERALTEMGHCEVLIANAGVSTMRHALKLTDEEWDVNFAVNARGIFLTNQIAARHFVQRGAGRIVNIASLTAKVAAPLLAHYSASKFAVLGWTQAIAHELAPKGIGVNPICTGPAILKVGIAASFKDCPDS